ncbi:alpha-amylase family glycosyl hydrolase [Actinomadura rupiterrae]|uniref:alpha-amylase family glycosyl hydrolase n=1 Tax=Actinomadura rupiterrae TaxID=559627 RepID=UPI0020A2B6A2|nr:alpha-amylase family glycosyl hydrolase [Actinomadura rupiterrae]MCP2335397.1 maltooligosyltrehalose synthase [Actinomadura rupiterrae]
MSDPAQPPSGTYRLQLRAPGFRFAEAAALAPYLKDLGVSHVYLSPVLQAAPGSTHGYDVADHGRISAELGGEDAFVAMVHRFHSLGLRVLLDIVPNHMAFSGPAVESVLADGPKSPYAHWFDVDWDAGGGRLVPPGEGEPNYRRFFDISGLIALRQEDPSVFDATHDLVVRLVRDGLVDGLRIDHPDGLADPHGYLRRLSDRIDPGRDGGPWVLVEKITAPGEELPAGWLCAGTTGYDALGTVGGLFLDPAGEEPLTATYSRFTSSAPGSTDGAPEFATGASTSATGPSGSVGGASGSAGGASGSAGGASSSANGASGSAGGASGSVSGSLGSVGGASGSASGASGSTGSASGPVGGSAGSVGGWTGVGGDSSGFAEVEWEARNLVAEEGLRPDVERLHRVLVRSRPGDDPDALREAMVELLVAMPVYRAYVVPGEGPTEQALRVLDEAARRCRSPLVPAVVREALYGDPEFVVRFQQVSAPLAAKGVEDTAFYRWSRMASLNEVGGDPTRFAVAPADFHAYCGGVAADWPLTMTTLSTHDTKRQEDVRARLAVLAEIPDEWDATVTAWHSPSSPLEPDLEYLMWQTLVGAWPITEERMRGFLTKAMREAKTATNWITPDEAYERAVLDYLHGVLASETTDEITRFVARLEPRTRSNVLSQKIVQLAMPGVPDLYQGCELVSLSLVDPDNRRPVDYGRRRTRLTRLDNNGAPGGLDDEKLLVTSRTLRLRRDHPTWFAPAGRPPPYEPLAAIGPAAEHAVAFRRGRAAVIATRLPAGLERRGGWASTVLDPGGDGHWRDVLTGYVHQGPLLDLAAVLDRMPVALLVPEDLA